MSSSRSSTDPTADWNKFLSEAKPAFADLVRHRAERMAKRGTLTPGMTPDDLEKMAARLFETFANRFIVAPGKPRRETEKELKHLMKRYTKQKWVVERSLMMMESFVDDFGTVSNKSGDVLQWHAQVNAVIYWGTEDKDKCIADFATALSMWPALHAARSSGGSSSKSKKHRR
ncbi:hypothetical protein G7046_g4978 [Stylonectria norvegica]|nr:hypothetical protein G7046_g4978 [Stylonectria norvegica]